MRSTGHMRMFIAIVFLLAREAVAQVPLQPVVPKDQRGRNDAERSGFHDAGNIRTVFWNYGMVGDYPADPLNVDLSVFHSVEIPKGSGLNYADGITPFVLAKITLPSGGSDYIMETGYRERQAQSPYTTKTMRFEPRPGYLQSDPTINRGRSIALSNDPRTWPNTWPDKLNDLNDPGWAGSWNGYFGKRPNADQESYFVIDDDYYDAWNYYPDSRDATRRGLGLRMEVRGFQWANPQATNVIFWHYDITNESTTNYVDNIIFGLYMDSGVGGESYSCDGVAESDDDNAFFDRSLGVNLVYTWDKYGHGVSLSSNCTPTGYLGYAYMETPGNSSNGIDDDRDGITDERRDSGPGQLITGQDSIRTYVTTHYNMTNFEAFYGKLENRPAFKAGRWWTGDEDMDWVADYDDVGADGVPGTHDIGEGDGKPTAGEPDFDQTDPDESDQIGLTGFKMNRIKGPTKADTVDDIVFYGLWPPRLYQMWTDPTVANRFDNNVGVLNYNIAFLFASGTFRLAAGEHERFSLALAYGADLGELKTQVHTVQQIYNASYQFAVPPPMPTVTGDAGDKYVRISWSDYSERGINPVTHVNDFEGYKIYRSTDPEFRDPKVITNANGTGPFGNGKPIAQFDLKDGIGGFSKQTVEGVAYELGSETGLTHTYIDTTVINGQDYYYAVCAYNYGSDSLDFFPSENSIAVSRTPRGGTILPANVVEMRPDPKVLGYVSASASVVQHTSGDGTAAVNLRVIDPKLVPDKRTLLIRFYTDLPDQIHATRYELFDSTTQKTVFDQGKDFVGAGTGPFGLGILPIINTPLATSVDSGRSGFRQGGSTNAKLKFVYLNVDSANTRRPGYPDDFVITFSNTYLDTSLAQIGAPAIPVKFKITADTGGGTLQYKFFFRDEDADGALSKPGEFIDILTHRYSDDVLRQTWRVSLDTTGQYTRGTLVVPTLGDIFDAKLSIPVNVSDVYSFTTTGQSISQSLAKTIVNNKPYVVPNPYAGAAGFEPERFATTGRGDRRMEFRNIPMNGTIRIYTVHGDLVRSLHQDASVAGYVAWDLRTKDNLDVAPGLYIYEVEAPGMDSFVGKFAIIK